MGEGPACRFDSVRVAGILLWEQPPAVLPSGYREREADARGFLDTYTAWANGEVYGYEIERITTCDASGTASAEFVDSCFGFYGFEHCLSEAEAYLQPST